MSSSTNPSVLSTVHDLVHLQRTLKMIQLKLKKKTGWHGFKKYLVIIRSKKSDLVFSGRTENNRVVNFSGEEKLIGTMVKMKITEVLPNSLRGELV